MKGEIELAKLKAHRFADWFPMMSQEELDALTEDIRAGGLRQPIVRYKGEVLDGRNRLLACERAEVEPTFTDFEGEEEEAFKLVISLNAQRRAMTPAKQAIVAARAMAFLPERRGGDRKSAKASANGADQKDSTGHFDRPTREGVAKAFKVGHNQVQKAKALLDEAPDLVDRVEACTLSLEGAYDLLKKRREEKVQAERDAELVAEYRDAISRNEVTMEAVLARRRAELKEEAEKDRLQKENREMWYAKVAGLVDWAVESVAFLTDEDLDKYVNPDAPGADPEVTAVLVRKALDQLGRIHKAFVRSVR